MNTRKARALIAIGADSKELDRDLKAAQKKMRNFQRGAKKLGGKMFGGAKGIGSALLGGVGMAAGMGLTEIFGDVFDFEKSLTRFQIASGKSTADMMKLRQSILDVSKATGVSASDVLAGAQTYVDLTGDVAGAEKAMSSFARVAQASGASVSDVAQATAAMQMSGKLAADDIEKVWSGLITQGKAGAVSVKDMAGELSTLMPMMAKFAGGTGLEGIRDMGAAFQVVRRGAGSASEASTKLQSLVGSLVKNAPKLRRAGINVFKWNPKTKQRELIAFRDIVGQVAKKKMDAEKLGKVIGADKESLQAIDMLTKELALYDELKEAGKDTGSVERDLSTYLESPAGKLETMFATLKATVAEAFTPERIQKFTAAIVKLLEAFTAVVGLVEKFLDLTDMEKSTTRDLSKMQHDALVKSAQNMSPEQKRATAEKWLRESASIDAEGDVWKAGAKAGRKSAADEIMKDDQWYGKSGSRLDLPAFTLAINQALAKATIVVQTNANQIAKTVDNAPEKRKPARPR